MSQPAPAPELSSLKGEIHTVEPDRLGRSIARRSAEVRATVPDLELSADADAGAALALGIPLAAVVIRACALALRDEPRANAAYRDGRYELYSRVNVGVVLPSGDGQLVGSLLDADQRTAAELGEELDRLRARAAAGELTSPEMAGTTFTFSEALDSRAHRVTPLVIPPQAAAVCAGALRAAPVVRDGALVAGELVTLTLACDHRILFGTRAAAFLTRIVELVEDPPA